MERALREAGHDAPAQRSGVARLAGEVLVIGPLPPPIMGPAAQTAMVLNALKRAGARVFHVDTRDERPIFNVDAFDFRNVALGLLHSRQTLAAVRRPVDLVCISISQSRWGYVRDAVLLAITRQRRRRIVAYFHGAQFQHFYASSTRFERWVIRRTLSWVDFAVVLTPGLRAVFDGLVAPTRIRVLGNAIADPFPEGIEPLIAERQQRARRDAARMRLLYIANDFGRKGAATAIRALAERGLERCQLRMIGEPSPRDAAEVAALGERLGVADRVITVGPLEGARKFAELRAADAFVYPTEYDAQPLVVIEALAAGLPIVASAHGGVPETIGEAGLLVEPGDHAAVAERLRSLIDEPERRSALGDAARARYRKLYTPELFDARVAELFAELIGEAEG